MKRIALIVIVAAICVIGAGTASAGNINNPGQPGSFCWIPEPISGAVNTVKLVINQHNGTTIIRCFGHREFNDGVNVTIEAGSCVYEYKPNTVKMLCRF